MTYAYGAENTKQLGDKIIIIDRHYRQAIGYTVATWNGVHPNELKDKVYTAIENTGGTWDGAYDMLYGKPTAPNFRKVLA